MRSLIKRTRCCSLPHQDGQTEPSSYCSYWQLQWSVLQRPEDDGFDGSRRSLSRRFVEIRQLAYRVGKCVVSVGWWFWTN